MPEDSPEEKGFLEEAQTRLYDPRAAPGMVEHPLSQPEASMVSRAWSPDPLGRTLRALPLAEAAKAPRHLRLALRFFIVAVIFFVVSVGAVFYVSTIGGNTVSVNKIDLRVQGPTTIAGGDEVTLALAVTNTNAVPIQNAQLSVDFPEGTRDVADISRPFVHATESIGTIASGATVIKSVRAVLFGSTGVPLTVPVSLSYSAAGSNAVFVKKASYSVTVSTSPLSVSIDTPAEAVSGKPLTLRLTVRSNASGPLSNVVLSGVFPFGFSVLSSSVPFSGSVAYLGTLAPGDAKVITLTGLVTGQEREQRSFTFMVGTAKSQTDQSLAVTYMTQSASVAIAAPFISATVAVNGDSSPSVTLSPGALQSVSVSYANMLSTNVSDATISVTLDGPIDFSTVQTSNGFYQSSNHSILFSKDTIPGLANLAPGASGIGNFTFTTLDASAVSSSPMVTLTFSVSGTRPNEANVPELVTSSLVRTAKVTTVAALSASTLHSSGPLGNSGPIPPQVGKQTSYTIVWNVKAHGSPIAGAMLKATLPNYVTYTGVTTDDSTFSYDPGSRSVSWNIGDLAAGQSASGSFQVSLTPSSSQKTTAPTLVGAATFSGYDRFSGTALSQLLTPLTTEMPTESGYTASQASVQ